MEAETGLYPADAAFALEPLTSEPSTAGPATVAYNARKLARSLRTYEHAEECGAPASGVLVAIAVQHGRLVESIAALVSDALPIEQLPPLIQTINQLAAEVGHALEIDRLKPQPEFNARLYRLETPKTISTKRAAEFVRERWATERPAMEPAWSEQLRAAGRELAGPQKKSRCRPAEGRDQYFRQLRADGKAPAAIRDKWNGLREEQRRAIGGPKWKKIQPGDAGREVVKKVLRKKT